jgi:hypothetical protein
MPEIGQTAIGLPPVTSAVFLIPKQFWLNVGVWEEHPRCLCYPFGDKAWLYMENMFKLQNDLLLFLQLVRSARQAIHLQCDISANVLEIKTVRSPKCIVWCAVYCTWNWLTYCTRVWCYVSDTGRYNCVIHTRYT